MMIYLTDAQRSALLRYARGRRTSMAQAIREAVDRFLVAEGPARPRSRFVASAAGSARASVSEWAEELLREHLRRACPRP